MAGRASKLFDKVYGWLLGGAIGDAFGIRTEMMHYRDIEAQYGRVTHFDHLPARKPKAPALERFLPFGVPMELEGGFHPLGRWSGEAGVPTTRDIGSSRARRCCASAVRSTGSDVPITGDS